MSDLIGIKKYLTIVIEYEGEPPIDRFGIPVLGCKVTAIGAGDVMNEAFELQEALDQCDCEDNH